MYRAANGGCVTRYGSGNIVYMMTNVTKVQQAALRTIATDPRAAGVKGVTLDALEAKRLIKATDNGGAGLDWELTGDGRLLVGQVTEAPTASPTVPTDPFAAFDQYTEVQ